MGKIFTKKQIQSFPPYVKLGEKGCALRLHNDSVNKFSVCYYRDGGAWYVNIKIKEGKLYSQSPYSGMNYLSNQEFIPISKKKWLKDNEPYANGEKAYNINENNLKEILDNLISF